ncbi:hypothetical protein BX661DRAFT_186359 [Kickxella alabastrina]|uniref:uncharacterized protein n=1 Tax=Kickxella alabastrina TaxID=61397 RepID=UPI0022210C13|nr:uncharacterized protein BX661DRAFT_186359 [Kickxella alabastrina]KAI7823743.1 hypothetical protein BX661DRAFT_186359 [Kickxella alabastrina]
MSSTALNCPKDSVGIPNSSGGRRIIIDIMMASSTVWVDKMTSSWFTYPASWRMLLPEAKRPLIQMLPLVVPLVVWPASRFSKVVLPEPEGPRMAVSRPGLHVPLTWLRITLSSYLALVNGAFRA